jgi:hypothetical protein
VGKIQDCWYLKLYRTKSYHWPLKGWAGRFIKPIKRYSVSLSACYQGLFQGVRMSGATPPHLNEPLLTIIKNIYRWGGWLLSTPYLGGGGSNSGLMTGSYGWDCSWFSSVPSGTGRFIGCPFQYPVLIALYFIILYSDLLIKPLNSPRIFNLYFTVRENIKDLMFQILLKNWCWFVSIVGCFSSVGYDFNAEAL